MNENQTGLRGSGTIFPSSHAKTFGSALLIEHLITSLPAGRGSREGELRGAQGETSGRAAFPAAC